MTTLASPVEWATPPADLTLRPGEVHTWRASLVQPGWRFQAFERTLAADEQARARRFLFEKDQRRFIAARGLLRAVLARYLDARPGELRFDCTPLGKPFLVPPHAASGLRFNLSHTDGLVLIAVGLDVELGVDVERMRLDLDHLPLARRFFSTQESAWLQAMPTPLQAEGFFECWTCKEAFLKALGSGLTRRLDQFDVCLFSGNPTVGLCTHWDLAEASRWSIRRLMPGRGYAAALAVPAPIARLECWDGSGILA